MLDTQARAAIAPHATRRTHHPLVRRFLAALTGLLWVTAASAQSGGVAPWTFLSPADDLPYVSTADPDTGLPRPGDNGELFFVCFDDVYIAGVIVDSGPPDIAAVDQIRIGADLYSASGDDSGWYALETGPGVGDFGIAASFAAAQVAFGTSLADAGTHPSLAVEAISDGRSYPIVTAETGVDFGERIERLPCVEPGEFTDGIPTTPDGHASTPDAPVVDPAADAAPAGSGSSRMGSDPIASGGGSFAALLEAGGDVRLPNGTFELPYDVVPSSDLRLIGAGVDATTLVMSSIEVAGLTAEDIDLTVQGMTIVIDAPVRGALGFGEAISSYGGELILRDLVIANRSDHGESSVSGVSLVSGTLSGSDLLVEGFPFAGIYVEGGVANLRDVTLRGNRNGMQLEGFDEQPYAELRDVTLVDNDLAGIAVFNDASALVSGGTIARNGSEATYVAGTGSLTLEDLDISDHASYGVVAEGGRAVVRNVTLSGNANAIWALLDSTVTVERSDIVASSAFGVAGNGTGTTTLRRVTVDGSELSAVHAEEERRVVIEDSLIRNAGESGFNLVGSSRGEIRGSRVEAASINGVEARDTASVTVVDTVLSGNAGFGILVGDTARQDLRGVTYEANGAGSFQLPDASAAPVAPSEPAAPARPSRPSRSGAGTPSPATPAQPGTPATPPTPSSPAGGSSGTWQLDAAAEVLSYIDGGREFGFACSAQDGAEPVIYLSFPDVSVSSNADDIASFDFARANGTASSASWNFLDLGDGLFLTDDVATTDIVDKLLPDDGSTAWNTVIVSVSGRGSVLAVAGEPLVADLYLQLVCAQP